MYQNPQNTLTKTKPMNSRRNDVDSFNCGQRSKENDDRDYCTPVFKMRHDHDDEKQVVKSNEQVFMKSGHFVSNHKNHMASSKFFHSHSHTNPQISKNYPSYANQFFTPQKNYHQTIMTDSMKSQNQNPSSDQYLFINSTSTPYNTQISLTKIQSFQEADTQDLMIKIAKAKKQGQKLKDENLKLRLQKVKITSKNTKSDTFKLIPLKIEHQNLKKELQKLMQQKQLLFMNKQLKENVKNEPELKINGTQFHIIRNIPGSVYYQNDSKNHQLNEQQSIIEKNKIQPQSFSEVNKKVQNQSVNSQNQIKSHNQSIRNYISSNHESIKTVFKLDTQNTNKNQLTTNKNASFLSKQFEKSDKRKSEEENSKSTFMKFAKQSLKSGEKAYFQNYDRNEGNLDYRLSRQRENNPSAGCLSKTFNNGFNASQQSQQQKI